MAQLQTEREKGGGGRDRDAEREIANKSQTGRQRLTDTDLEGRIARQRQTDITGTDR